MGLIKEKKGKELIRGGGLLQKKNYFWTGSLLEGESNTVGGFYKAFLV